MTMTSPTGPQVSMPAPAPPPPADESSRYLNREVQWLEFNERVLAQALDPELPLLERARFIAIFSSNLDEFFMKRVGGLRRQIAAGIGAVTFEGVTPGRQLEMIREKVNPLIQRKAQCYREQILPLLREKGVHLLSYREVTEAERREINQWYRGNVFPVLTPLAVDPGHRFPFISNLSVSLGVMLRRPGDTELLFARVKVPEVFPKWHRLGEAMRFVPLQEIIEHNLDDLFPGMEIVKAMPFRVTRNADVEHDFEDADDLMVHIQQQLRERRFAPVVRLQVRSRPDRELLEVLMDELELGPQDIYETEGLIDFRSLYEIADLPLPEHRFQPWTPIIPPRLRDDERDIFAVIRDGDVLVHHPYE
ncbi:MAG: polyphosphate kinase 1, partial [Gemmatimonadetes bacterium]|nr:polyphosphate kinase 1 [Gemmatimonadota bacterium]